MNILRKPDTHHRIFAAGLALMALVFSFPAIIFSSSPNIPQLVIQLGDRLPKISFAIALSPEERKYPALRQKKNFSLNDIRTRLILIDFIGINCNYCIQSIPTMIEIYKTVEKDPGLKETSRWWQLQPAEPSAR